MLVGQKIGPFAIEKELGSGAMGTVYRARYLPDDRVVALKVIAFGLSGNDSALSRFEREAGILKQLRHPNIVHLHSSGKCRGTPFFAMEYISGESLDRIMARKDRFTWQEIVVIGKQLCAALTHAHEKGIVHRDLKPSNLMMANDGTLKLTDFGIAKDLDVTASDRREQHHRHRGVHVAGAVQRREEPDGQERPLFARRRLLRTAHGPQAVHGRNRPSICS